MGNGKWKMESFLRLKGVWKVLLAASFSIFNFPFPICEAQTPAVTARFDRDSVMIGEQFGLEVSVEKDLMQVVDFPVLMGHELAEEVEILSEEGVDTLAVDGRRQTLGKRYLLTIWREGQYNLGRFPALLVDKNRVDTLLAVDSLRIVVETYDIDLATDKPLGVKQIRRLFGEWSGWLALALLGIIVLWVIVWLVIKYRHKIPLLAGDKPLPPAHEEAIRKLEALRDQKLPQNGRHKQYYSGLTDILRAYMERRWGIGAMEMTSAEIVEALVFAHREGVIDDKRWSDLCALLHTADMVKFAKAQPEPAAEEADWYNAYYFVEETKEIVADE